MNFSALYSSVTVVYPMKISMWLDKFYVLKTSSMEDRVLLVKQLVLSAFFSLFLSASNWQNECLW